MSVAGSLIKEVLYPPEITCEARPINPGATAWTSLTEATYLQPWLCILRSLGAARNASTRARIRGTLQGRSYERIIEGPVLPLVDYRIPTEIAFDEDMFIDFYNSGALINNYQSRTVFELRDYSVAEKLAYGASDASFTEEELPLIDRFNLRDKIRRGELPMSRPLGTLRRQEVFSYYNVLAANTPVDLADINVAAGQKVILRRLWTLRPVANVTALTVLVSREQRLYNTIYPFVLTDYNAVMDPLELYIPAINRMQVQLLSTTGHAATDVGVVAEFDVRDMTVWDKVAWGLDRNATFTSSAERAAIAELGLKDLVRAGVYSLDEAWLHEHPR